MATTRRVPPIFFLLFLSATSVAAADDGWQQRDARMGRPQHYFSEFCIEVGKGKTLRVEIETPHRVDFNIHFHTETETLFPVREPVEGKAVFEVIAETGGSYCLMFTNPETRPEKFVIRTRWRVR